MNETKLTCFNFVVEKGKITLVTLVWLEKPCFENYVEMVAGLPRNEQNKIDQDLLRLINQVL